MGSSAQEIELTVYRGSKDGTIIQSKTHQGPLRGDQVLVKITHSGLCGTDEHYRSADQVLGHEGAGVVQEIGPDVDTLKKGDNVGFGYLHSSCGHCAQCLTGKETFCPQRVMYGTGDFDIGSLASHAVWRESYLFKIPENIPNEYAAPLQCGGATVFNALEMYDTRPTDRVGIIGVGGLGHLAIQFAAKMGCEVVVFSGTDSKKEVAMKLGAHEFYAIADVKDLSNICKPVNRLLVTTSHQPDWTLYIPVLAPEATIFPLSVSNGNLVIPYMPLLQNGIRIQGTIVAPREMHEQMLRFASVHDIKPIIEKFPLNKKGIEEAFEHLDKGEMRYRGVLVAQS
ncbi:hypothetical protein N7G274_001794 [Stereocaulon virgatum]|uniref:Enoyl reductase (ER) domain-containing protein n=1 Tax=Stereocaulon virgatum TaxID=373712 RepID=A0ABR4AKQ8_9LECA